MPESCKSCLSHTSPVPDKTNIKKCIIPSITMTLESSSGYAQTISKTFIKRLISKHIEISSLNLSRVTFIKADSFCGTIKTEDHSRHVGNLHYLSLVWYSAWGWMFCPHASNNLPECNILYNISIGHASLYSTFLSTSRFTFIGKVLRQVLVSQVVWKDFQ